MRRKVAILLAVPLLFLVSIMFLMSDIKNLSTQNDEFLTPPVPAENIPRVGKPFSKPDQQLPLPDRSRERDPLTPEESNTSPSERTNNGRVNSRSPTRPPHPQKDVEKHLQEYENRQKAQNIEKSQPKIDKLPPLVPDKRPPPVAQPAKENRKDPSLVAQKRPNNNNNNNNNHNNNNNNNNNKDENTIKEEALSEGLIRPIEKPQGGLIPPPKEGRKDVDERVQEGQNESPKENSREGLPDRDFNENSKEELNPRPAEPLNERPVVVVTENPKAKVHLTDKPKDKLIKKPEDEHNKEQETEHELVAQKLEDLPEQPKQSQTGGGFGNQAPEGVQSINEPKKVVGEGSRFAGSALSLDELNKRKEAVKAAYLHSWKSYEKFAWGHDELKPLSHSHQDWLSMGLSIVDSIDTMYLMGLTEEYEKARNWIATNLQFDINKDVSFFETTIRVVGGLVSIYDLTNDAMYLSKAEDLAKRLMPAFNTPTGIPYTTVHLQLGHATNPQWAAGASILSEAGTVQIEYATLSKRTGTEEYGRKALKVYDQLDSMDKPSGLYPVYINPHVGSFSRHQVTLGALGDSFYEYLLKVYLMTNKKEPKYQRMYEAATDAVISKLIKTSTPSGLTYIAEWENGYISDKMDHLVCFAGAMFALGAYHNVTTKTEEHLRLGKEITRTCHEFYKRQATGLGPELVRFSPGADFQPGATHYILRPETVESYYVLYWITGDPIYQEWGWEAFNAIEQYCRTPDGYTGVRDVTNTNAVHDDLQQSFFMAETLKYLYLLFAPRTTLSLDDFVFNTEAHPIKIWK